MSDLGEQLLQKKCICATSKTVGCINSSDWFDLCNQYAKGAKVIFENSEKLGNCHAGIFMLRHSIELLIKAILINDCHVPATEAIQAGHNLTSLRNQLTCIPDLDGTVDEDVISGFDSLDNGSFEFRYPVDKNNNSTCLNNGCIDTKLLVEQCDHIINFINILVSVDEV